jgi:hypothetical protein
MHVVLLVFELENAESRPKQSHLLVLVCSSLIFYVIIIRFQTSGLELAYVESFCFQITCSVTFNNKLITIL